MKYVILACLCLLNICNAIAAINPASTIDSLKLKDGSELKNVQFISYSPKWIVAKWDGGRGTIKYELLPDDAAEAVSSFRPAVKAANQGEATEKPRQISHSVDADRKARLDREQKARADLERPREFKGKAYIATKGGEVFSLAGITVYALPVDSFPEFERKREFEKAKLYEPKGRAYSLYESYSEVPGSVSSATTGADGSFTLKCPMDDVILIARGKRLAGRTWEYYVWTIKASAGSTTDLCNNNLRDSL